MSKIFVQIAAYRDPELVPTIVDALSKAKRPADLRFGICWQREECDDSLRSFMGNPQFVIDDVPYRTSEGLGWARARLQRMWQGEEFTMQLDSHHRFAPNWDEDMMRDLELTGSAKPILTSYAGTYDPAGIEPMAQEPYKMIAQKFTPHGTIMFLPTVIQGWQELHSPIRARFCSGHYFFTLGRHCEDYRYDPQIYFAGDEISLASRSFTLGYDLFHPVRLRVWHEYTRQGRPKHWDDHVTANALQAWHTRDHVSKLRLRQMLHGENNGMDLGAFGLGSVRTLAEYERYAGIDFKGRRLHPDALHGVEPPCSFTDDASWDQALNQRQHVFCWEPDIVPEADFIFLGIEDASGTLLHRVDLRDGLSQCQHAVSYQSATTPHKWVVWQHTNAGWGVKHEGLL